MIEEKDQKDAEFYDSIDAAYSTEDEDIEVNSLVFLVL